MIYPGATLPRHKGILDACKSKNFPFHSELPDTVIKTVKISNIGAIGADQCLRLTAPDGSDGSGLCILVGNNNSGKSTILRAMAALVKGEIGRASCRERV